MQQDTQKKLKKTLTNIIKEMAYADIHIKDIENGADSLPKVLFMSDLVVDGMGHDAKKFVKRADNMIKKLEKMNFEINRSLR